MNGDMKPEVALPRQGDPQTLAGYRVAGRLGEGGQGTVFLGYGSGGEKVAIKVLHARFGADPKARARFAREVGAARRVAAFCTARVLTADIEGDLPYIVSEFIDGQSLQEFVRRRGPQDGAALERLAIGTLTALAAVHQAGIVHRDFKPGNVLLPPEGPRVVDFGIARTLDATSTLTSQAVGTPAYMAPEQLDGQRAGPATDMFAWGGTMVYAATGSSPFGSDSVAAVIAAVLDKEPDLSGLVGPLRPIVASCLAKDPATRPGAAELLARLLSGSPAYGGPADSTREAATRILAELYPAQAPPTVPPPGPLTTQATKRLPRRLLIGAGAVALAGVIGGPFLLRGGGGGRTRWRHNVRGDRVENIIATDDTLFYAPGSGPLCALDAATGRQRWAYDGTFGGLVLSGQVLFAANENSVDAVDAASGQKRWSAQGAPDKLAVGGDVLVTATRDSTSADIDQWLVTGMSAVSGEPRWKRTLSRPAQKMGAAGPDTLSASARVVAVTVGMTVYGLATATGKVLWQFHLNGNDRGLGVVVGDTVLIGARNVNQSFFALDAASGRPRWQAPVVEFSQSSLAADTQTVYVSGTSDGLHAFDVLTGRERWRSGVGRSGETWGPAGGLVYATAGVDGNALWAVDAATGRILWVDDRSNPSAVAANSKTAFLVAGGNDSHENQTIYALRAAK
jgi:outer membrane protein assembly factor BamB/predicted Ser/Thr protein kinase